MKKSIVATVWALPFSLYKAFTKAIFQLFRANGFYFYTIISFLQILYFKKMINGSDFEDKAARLMNRLAVATTSTKINNKSRVDVSRLPLQDLIKIKE